MEMHNYVVKVELMGGSEHYLYAYSANDVSALRDAMRNNYVSGCGAGFAWVRREDSGVWIKFDISVGGQ